MITKIVQICLVFLFSLLTKYIISFINAKKEEVKTKINNQTAKEYTDIVAEAVINGVNATNQTFVDDLKKKNAFDAENQKIAFSKTLESVLSVLNDDAKRYLTEATGNLTAYLTQLIESRISLLK